MALRWLLLLGICCSLTSPAAAGDPAKLDLKRRVSCVLVRYYVAKYTVAAAEAYARGKGASEAEIEAAIEDKAVLDAAIVANSQAVEHYEILATAP